MPIDQYRGLAVRFGEDPHELGSNALNLPGYVRWDRIARDEFGQSKSHNLNDDVSGTRRLKNGDEKTAAVPPYAPVDNLQSRLACPLDHELADQIALTTLTPHSLSTSRDVPFGFASLIIRFEEDDVPRQSQDTADLAAFEQASAGPTSGVPAGSGRED